MESRSIDAIVRCPVTGQDLIKATPDEIGEMNRRLSESRLPVAEETGVPVIEAGWFSSDHEYFYPVIDGIHALLKTSAIRMKELAGDAQETQDLRKEKQSVIDFYDQFGWKATESGVYRDSEKFMDLRPVVRDYFRRCNLRVRRYLRPHGQYLLDVASGPVHHPEQQTYHENFEKRICVDLSVNALREAQKNVGDRGIYIQGDITNLPFRDQAMDGVVSMHTIYHVPEDEQLKAVREISRVLSPGSTGIIVYTWGRDSLLMKLAFFPSKVLRAGRRLASRLSFTRPEANSGTEKPESVVASPPLYFHNHPYAFFIRHKKELSLDIRVWKSLSTQFTKVYVHRSGGKLLLRLVSWLEDTFPHVLGRIGQYPMFIINKQDFS